MAACILATGMSPTEYRSLTLLEREEIVKAVDKSNRKK